MVGLVTDIVGLVDLHAFEAAVTGFNVLFDGYVFLRVLERLVLTRQCRYFVHDLAAANGSADP